MKPKTNDTGLINNQPTNTGLKQKTKEPVKRILNKKPSTGKPKELDWKSRLSMRTETSADGLKLFWTVVIDGNVVESLGDLGKFIDETLTQQRTELENQKVKVVWNNVCEQIKQEVRTELLEEIKGFISSIQKQCYLADGTIDGITALHQLVEYVNNLSNKEKLK